MHFIETLLQQQPLVALFVTIAVGFFIGKFKAGRFVLGGIAGTLITGVVVGQVGVQIDEGIKGVFFALFIYAVGYQGGPQFFRALNLKSLNQLVSALAMTVTGLLVVLGAAFLFDLDRGTAAGLAAGGLTQSAILGTAGGAISKLNVSPDLVHLMQTNVAVGYAVCYIFGSLGPILMVTWFFPTVMKWDIRKAAVAYAARMSGGKAELEPGEFEAVPHTVTRCFRVGKEDGGAGRTVLEVDRALGDASIEIVLRGKDKLDPKDDLKLAADDLVAVTGLVGCVQRAAQAVGEEVTAPASLELVEERREVVVATHEYVGQKLGELEKVDKVLGQGIHVEGIRRMGHDLPLLPNLELHRGDDLRLVGRPNDLDRASSRIGHLISAKPVTDFIMLGIGMVVGLLLGSIQVHLAGIPVSIGAGGGCLLSGLLFGWLHTMHPRLAAMPPGATNLLRDFGLAVFVGIVGLNAGKHALVTIEQYGLTLLLLGACVTLIPMLIVFPFSYFVLRIKDPIDALGCVAGGRSANPAFAALLSKAGNATPVVPFTVTYAVANVFLTLWGPLIVGIITKNPAAPAS